MNNSRRTKKKRRSLFDLSIKPLNILSTSDRTTSFCFYDSFSELDATTSQRQLIAQYYFFSAACLTSFAVQASSQHFSRSTLFFRGGWTIYTVKTKYRRWEPAARRTKNVQRSISVGQFSLAVNLALTWKSGKTIYQLQSGRRSFILWNRKYCDLMIQIFTENLN